MSKENHTAKDAIKTYLDNRAATDPQFATAYAKTHKSIDECFRYIIGEAAKRGTQVCMTDEEVFGLAVHYYDEDDIKVSRIINTPRVSTSHEQPAVELTDEEKATARQEAIKAFQAQCLAEEKQKAKERRRRRAEKTDQIQTPSLFNFAD